MADQRSLEDRVNELVEHTIDKMRKPECTTVEDLRVLLTDTFRALLHRGLLYDAIIDQIVQSYQKSGQPGCVGFHIDCTQATVNLTWYSVESNAITFASAGGSKSHSAGIPDTVTLTFEIQFPTTAAQAFYQNGASNDRERT